MFIISQVLAGPLALLILFAVAFVTVLLARGLVVVDIVLFAADELDPHDPAYPVPERVVIPAPRLPVGQGYPIGDWIEDAELDPCDPDLITPARLERIKANMAAKQTEPLTLQVSR